jgi:hypothetical protein
VPPKPAPSKARKPNRALLRFSGPPARVQALVPIPADTLTGASLTLELDTGPVAVPALAVASAPGQSTVRLVPAQPLPAGHFRGRLATLGESLEAEVEVLGKARARPYPTRLELETRGESEVTVDLLNTGNVDLQVAEAYAIPLEASGTLGRAIVAGITTKERGVQRWGAAADSIAASQAGVARVAVRDGAGPIPPGQSRRVVAVVRLPDELEAGVTYVGSWRLDGRNVPLRVTVPGEQPAPRARASREQQPSRRQRS